MPHQDDFQQGFDYESDDLDSATRSMIEVEQTLFGDRGPEYFQHVRAQLPGEDEDTDGHKPVPVDDILRRSSLRILPSHLRRNPNLLKHRSNARSFALSCQMVRK
jgi:hypothetical protein